MIPSTPTSERSDLIRMAGLAYELRVDTVMLSNTVCRCNPEQTTAEQCAQLIRILEAERERRVDAG